MAKKDRLSGILLHITSLPSPYGIGDLGPEAYAFADRLAEAGQHYWQILPLNPTEIGSGNSPYSSPSAFAGNVLLISPELLVKDGLLDKKDIGKTRFPADKVDFPKVIDHKIPLLNKAFVQWQKKKPPRAYREFVKAQQHWLEDHALFMALKAYFGEPNWNKWPDPVRNRDLKALKDAAKELQEQLEREKFLQYIFFQQWYVLKEYCRKKNIRIIGDMPFYVDHNSVDVWVNRDLFKLDKENRPVAVAGVPPDYFSETGQLWGNPVYDMMVHKKQKFAWWVARIRQNMLFFDLLRLDHFRAFSEYWEVPAGEKTAINGKYMPGPGHAFFNILQKEFPNMPFIAEDLGDIDDKVRKLMNDHGLPGMKLLLFAFSEDVGRNIYAPHLHVENSITYTGTHDNNTVKGWWEKEAKAKDRKIVKAYLDKPITKNNVAHILLKENLRSVARTAIFPIQDLLALGAESRMNTPSTASDNWHWRVTPQQMGSGWEKELKKWTVMYGRDGQKDPKGEKEAK